MHSKHHEICNLRHRENENKTPFGLEANPLKDIFNMPMSKNDKIL